MKPERPYLEIAKASTVLFRSMKVLKDKKGAESQPSESEMSLVKHLNFQHLP